MDQDGTPVVSFANLTLLGLLMTPRSFGQMDIMPSSGFGSIWTMSVLFGFIYSSKYWHFLH